MIRLAKRVIVVLVGLVVLVIIVAVILIANLGKLVEAGVEKGGTLVLGVPTELDGASVSILAGSVGLDGLTLGSPKGFEAPEMFRLGHGHTKADLASLMSDEIVVREVVIDGPEIVFEFSGRKTNWGVLMERLRSEPTEEEKKAGKKIRIDRIVFSNGKVKLAGIPLAGTAGIPLPDLEIRNLGAPDGTGVTIRTALTDVVASLNTSVVGVVKGAMPAEQLADLGDELESVLTGTGDLAGEAGVAAEEVVKDAAEKAKGILGDILGNDEDEGH
jgi:hypothetical protein